MRQNNTHLRQSVLIVLAGAAFVGLSLMTLYFAAQVKRLQAENQQILADHHTIERYVQELEEVMVKVNAYNDIVDELTTATVDPDARTTRKSGQRLTEIRELISRLKQYSDLQQARENLPIRLEELYRSSSRLERNLRALVTIINHRRDVFDSMPSITPATGWVSSFYGRRKSPFSGDSVLHRGIDIGAEQGTDVYATAGGTVHYVGYSPSFGRLVILKHDYDTYTKYAHNSKTVVYKGQKVKRGQKIAEVGSTGRSTGAHLHYEIWVKNRPVDPIDYLLDKKLDDLTLATTDFSESRHVGGEEIVIGNQQSSNLPKNELKRELASEVSHITSPWKRNVLKTFRQWLGFFIVGFGLVLFVFTVWSIVKSRLTLGRV